MRCACSTQILRIPDAKPTTFLLLLLISNSMKVACNWTLFDGCFSLFVSFYFKRLCSYSASIWSIHSLYLKWKKMQFSWLIGPFLFLRLHNSIFFTFPKFITHLIFQLMLSPIHIEWTMPSNWWHFLKFWLYIAKFSTRIESAENTNLHEKNPLHEKRSHLREIETSSWK